MAIRLLIFVLAVVCVVDIARAQTTGWEPAAGHAQVAIWPGAAPDALPVAGPEVAETTGKEFLVAGRPVVGVSRVTRLR